MREWLIFKMRKRPCERLFSKNNRFNYRKKSFYPFFRVIEIQLLPGPAYSILFGYRRHYRDAYRFGDGIPGIFFGSSEL